MLLAFKLTVEFDQQNGRFPFANYCAYRFVQPFGDQKKAAQPGSEGDHIGLWWDQAVCVFLDVSLYFSRGIQYKFL